MIIKKWSGTAWSSQAVETTVRSLRTSTANFGSSNEASFVFDTNNKLKEQYLPDSVFGGMKFFSTITTAQSDTAAKLASLMDGVYLAHGQSNIEAMVGSYFIADGNFSMTYVATPTQAGTTGRYYCLIGQTPSEENGSDSGAWTVETGDWWVITDISGTGSSGAPYVVKLATINNTYGIMTAGSYGIAKVGYTTDAANRNYKVDISSGNLYVNVPWSDTIYTHPTSGANTTIVAANGTVLSSITVDALGHTTAVGSKALASDDIPNIPTSKLTSGILSVARGGTGADTFTSGQVLIGAGTGAVTTASRSGIDSRTAFPTTPANISNSTAYTLLVGTGSGYTELTNGATGKVLKTGALGPYWGDDNNTTYTAGDGLTLTGNDFDLDYPVYWGTTLPNGEKTGAIGFEG